MSRYGNLASNRRSSRDCRSTREVSMRFAKTLAAAAMTALLGSSLAAAQTPPVQIEFWHGLTQPLGGMLEQIVADFNAAQTQYKINPSFKGQYPEVMTAA